MKKMNISENNVMDYSKEITHIKRHVNELDIQVKEICTLSPTYAMTQRMEEISEQIDRVLEDNDRLKCEIGKLIDKKTEDKPEILPNEIREVFEKSGMTLNDLSSQFKINLEYAQKVINGESENVSLKKKIFSYLSKRTILMKKLD